MVCYLFDCVRRWLRMCLCVTGGWTYCGIGTLSILGKLPKPARNNKGRERPPPPPGTFVADQSFIDNVLHWLVSRQTTNLVDEDEIHVPDSTPEGIPALSFTVQRPARGIEAVIPSVTPSIHPLLDFSPSENLYAGFNGRCNKVADTCYSFWIGGTLGVSLIFTPLLLFSPQFSFPSPNPLTTTSRSSKTSTC